LIWASLASGALGDARCKGIAVLLVDDRPDVLELFRRLLSACAPHAVPW